MPTVGSKQLNLGKRMSLPPLHTTPNFNLEIDLNHT